ncbi:hypothetical protein PIB30_085216 [Stylosanthes scabra]|uniref:Uncharacterized protein n=1 Tax=Stylosanthes scabra TaxID=79078 RepID=A0ABU6ZRB0_9FABA|nr:hypothetical protein [Stylosanthes scabra]
MDYLCWGLQQTNPHLAPIPSQDILAFCLSNMEKGKGKFEGALRPIPLGGSLMRMHLRERSSVHPIMR